MSSEQSMTIRDIVRELDVNDKTVRRWIQNGELKATRDILGRYRITREDFEDFLRRRREKFGSGSAEE
jgi:excisionase family DNA binding protein